MTSGHRPVELLLAAALVAGTAADAHAQAAPGAVDPSLYSSLRYRHIGPTGNRVSSVAGVVGDPSVYYAGSASGGIFKTEDAGLHWSPIFDDQLVSAVGAMAVAPSDPNVVWAGTGEPYIRSNISVGWGVYRSTDAGDTWIKMGLENTGRIGRIAIDPRDPNTVFVAAVGHAYAPQPERGVYRTTDGGETWEHVLFVDEDTGAYDVELDPSNPRIVYATTWELWIKTWGRHSGGPGSAIWKSTDGGDTWARLEGNGLPEKPIGKVDVAVAPSNPDRVYALIETSDGVPLPNVEPEAGELWRSENGGGSWQLVSYDRQLAGRTQYYTRMIVAPDDENEAYFLAASWAKTLDGGATTIDPPFTSVPGGDHHDIWIDPTNADRMVVGHDQGLSITVNRGESWNRIQLPNAQMYHVTVDNQVPYYVYGNRQDGPSTMGPSNSKLQGFFGAGTIPRGAWSAVGGGESGWATPDPVDPNIVWSSASGFGSVGGIVTRYDARTRLAHNMEVWPEMTAGHTASDVRYRFYWHFPLEISPHDHERVYVGSQFVHVTSDEGRSWDIISPDLTLADTTRMGVSGGLTPDNIGVEFAGVLYAIAESPVMEGLIWAGTNDGLVHLSRDGGQNWTNVTENVDGLLEWGTISRIEPSRHAEGTAYMAVDGHQIGNFDPWLYKTDDFGESWTQITNGIDATPLSYARWIEEDPVRAGLLYAGFENAIYVSFDDGATWQPLQTNLPHAPVYGIVVQEHFNDLVIGTYGRGFWIMDDITPLQQLTADVMQSDVHLFEQRAAYRFLATQSPFAPFEDPVQGENPAYGASINYWLGAGVDGPVTVAIEDGTGELVRTLEGGAAPGINRVQWDLQSELSQEPIVRTAPLYAPEVQVPVEGRPAPGVGRVSRRMPPGTYTVRLTVGDQEQTTTLEVIRDPNSNGTEADIAVQGELLDDVTEQLNGVVDMINQVENVRGQIAAFEATSDDDDIGAAADSLEQALIAVEEDMFQMRITGRGQDVIRYPAKVAEKMVYLFGDVGGSDVSPTVAQRDVARVLFDRAADIRRRLDEILQGDVAAFNALLREKGLGAIIS